MIDVRLISANYSGYPEATVSVERSRTGRPLSGERQACGLQAVGLAEILKKK